MKNFSARFSNLRPRLFWRLSLAFAALTLILGSGMFLAWKFAWDQFGPILTDGSLMMRGCINNLNQYYDSHEDWVGAEGVLNSSVCRRGLKFGPKNPYVLLLADETGIILASSGDSSHEKNLTKIEYSEAEPLLFNNRLVGLLYTNQPKDSGALFFQRLLRLGVILVIITLVAGLILSKKISNPIALLTRASQAIEAGDLSTRVPIVGRAEERNLAISFNNMADQVEQTIVTLRHFVSDAAHEINSPLMALRTNLELAPQDEAVRNALLQAQRLEQLTSDLLDLSRIEGRITQESFTDVFLTSLIEEVSEIYASRAEQLGIDYFMTLPDNSPIVHGDSIQLRRAIGNLLDNAIKFTPKGGQVAIMLRQVSKDAVVIITDTGIGIPSDDLPHLFGRFHRGHNTSNYPGSGLGLVIVKAIVDGHGGRINIESQAKGVRVTLLLPLVLKK